MCIYILYSSYFFGVDRRKGKKIPRLWEMSLWILCSDHSCRKSSEVLAAHGAHLKLAVVPVVTDSCDWEGICLDSLPLNVIMYFKVDELWEKKAFFLSQLALKLYVSHERKEERPGRKLPLDPDPNPCSAALNPSNSGQRHALHYSPDHTYQWTCRWKYIWLHAHQSQLALILHTLFTSPVHSYSVIYGSIYTDVPSC